MFGWDQERHTDEMRGNLGPSDVHEALTSLQCRAGIATAFLAAVLCSLNFSGAHASSCLDGPTKVQDDNAYVTYKATNNCRGTIRFYVTGKTRAGNEYTGHWSVGSCSTETWQWFPGVYDIRTDKGNLNEADSCLSKNDVSKRNDPNQPRKGQDTSTVPAKVSPQSSTFPALRPNPAVSSPASDCFADTQSCLRACIQRGEMDLMGCTKQCSQDDPGLRGFCFPRTNQPDSTQNARSIDWSSKIGAAREKAKDADRIVREQKDKMLGEERDAVATRDRELAEKKRRQEEDLRIQREHQLAIARQQQQAAEAMNGFLNGMAGAMGSSGGYIPPAPSPPAQIYPQESYVPAPAQTQPSYPTVPERTQPSSPSVPARTYAPPPAPRGGGKSCSETSPIACISR